MSDLFTKSNFMYGNMFANPYSDIASTYLPKDIKKTFAWCEYVYLAGGIIKAATDRIVQYFITEIQYEYNTENTEKLKEVLEKKMNIKSILTNIGKDYLTYGNSVNSVYFPFIRDFKCPACGININSIKLDDYDYDGDRFKGVCVCGKDVIFIPREREIRNSDLIKVIRLDPKAIDIKRHPLADVYQYFWHIPKDFSNPVKQDKDKFFIDYTPLEFLDAIYKEKPFKWDENYIYHMKLPTLAGFPLEWGCPIFLHVLKLNYYTAVLRKANEAIALDFCIPFRVLSPGQSSPNMDPVSNYELSSFTDHMNNMVRRHRLDPADIQIAPFPINYQAFGAEKKALDVTAEIKAAQEEMLHTLNYPAELFYNSLKFQAFPPALRLFENTWTELVSGLNGFLQWLSDHVCSFMRWKKEKVSLTKVTIADDVEKRQILMQLAGAQQASWIDALKAYNLDFKEQQKKIGEQERIMADIMKDVKEEMAVEQELAETPDQQQNPMDINSQAQQQAQVLLNMPYEQRVQVMRSMEAMNPTLHALTKQVMEKTRNSARTQQGYQNLEAAGMAGHAMPPQE